MDIVPKQCGRCGEEFPPTSEYFGVDRAQKSGLRNICKTCYAKIRRKRREDNIDEFRAYEREQKKKQWAKDPEKSREKRREKYANNAEQEREAKRRWRKENPERAREINRKYEQTHREKVRESKHRYVVEHPEQRERIRQWKKEHPERVRELLEIWKANNPERAKEHSRNTHRRWAATHPEKVLESARRRRALKAGAVGFYTEEDVLKQYDAQMGLCCWCLKPLTEFVRDHLIALAKGGTNWSRNIVVACPYCNSSKWCWIPFYEWTPPFLRHDTPCSALEWLIFMDVVERFMELVQTEASIESQG